MKKSAVETLCSCPECGQENFTAAGLRAHQGNKTCKKRVIELERYLLRTQSKAAATPEAPTPIVSQALAKVSTGKLTHGPKRRVEAEQFPLPNTTTDDLAPAVVEPPTEQDHVMGAQLTEQHASYQQGEQDQKLRGLLLGAMGLKLRAHLVVSSQGHNSATRGPTAKGTGLKGWLEAWAPSVTRSNLYDWMAIAEGVQAHFRLAENVDLKALMCSSSEELQPELAKVADRIRKYLEGKSRTQLHIQFANRTTGGKQERSGEPAEKDPVAEALDIWKPLLTRLAEDGLQKKSWAHLPQAELQQLKGLLVDLNKALKGE